MDDFATGALTAAPFQDLVADDAAHAPIKRRILAPHAAAAAVRSGIIRAARDYQLWSDEWPSDRGVENLLQVRAAEALFAIMRTQGLGFLTLEQSMAEISYNGTAKRGPRYAAMSDRQRADIAIWTKAPEVYGLVEIKRAETDQHWRADLEKLARLLKTYCRGNRCHLRYAILGAYISSRTGAIDLREQSLRFVAKDVEKRFGLKARVCMDDVRHLWDEADSAGMTCTAGSVVLTLR